MTWAEEWLTRVAEQSSTALLFDITVKASILVLVAMVLLRLLPRSSAALRHRVWCLMFCGLMVLPVLCYVLPAWTIPILPSFRQPRQQVATADQAPSEPRGVNETSASSLEQTDQRRADGGAAWDSGMRTKEVNMKLPRGVVVRGQVLEEGSGKPVARASVQYTPESANNRHIKNDILTGWQAIEVTDEQGRFEIVILRGPGRLLVHGPRGDFVLRETSSGELYNGRLGGKRNYAHGIERIEPAAEAESLDVTIRLERGGKASGALVDSEGRTVGGVLMVTRLAISPHSMEWRGHPQELIGGRFELTGLAPNREYPVHFVHPKRQLGATAMIKAAAEPMRVVLEPCGLAKMRFVDAEGKPVADHDPSVRLVVTPGPLDWNRNEAESETLAAEETFIANVDRQNHWDLKADGDGHVTLLALIPGATYRVLTVKDENLVVAKEFQAKSGETLDLGEIVFERGEK